MATSSTVPTAKTALTNLLITAHTGDPLVKVAYAWPGPDAKGDLVYLGRPPDESSAGTSRVPTMRSGRQPRQESYTIEVTHWAFRGDATPQMAATVEARGFALLAITDGLLANDPDLGVASNFVAQSGDFAWRLIPFEKGWAVEIISQISCSARLS